MKTRDFYNCDKSIRQRVFFILICGAILTQLFLSNIDMYVYNKHVHLKNISGTYLSACGKHDNNRTIDLKSWKCSRYCLEVMFLESM
jgi:hypothetical protein